MSIWETVRRIPDMLDQGIRDPVLIGLGLNKGYYQALQGRRYNKHGTDIFRDEDWDNLILLDACRYDMYNELTPFDGDPETRESRGSTSGQFVYGNFENKTLHDVVYVSGNRWFLKLKEELGSEVHAFYDVERDAAGGYVPSPESVTDAALEAASRHPKKRLLIHYMQPHKPYLGDDTGRFVYPRGEGLRGTLQASRADRSDLVSAYRENLRLVLTDVQTLINELDGKTVISADHGELLGERIFPMPIRWYGHPSRIYTDTLVKVPWHVVSGGHRKKIQADPPANDLAEPATEAVEENLRELGYKV